MAKSRTCKGTAPLLGLFISFYGCFVAFALENEVQELPEVTVIGEKQVEPSDSVSFSQIEASRQETLEDGLESQPSIAIERTGGEGTPKEYIIRGQDLIQNRYFLEGIPLYDAQFYSGEIDLLPLDSIDAIDLYPGRIPMFLGSDGLGGALQFRLKGKKRNEVGIKWGSFAYLSAYGNVGKNPHLGLEFVRSTENFPYYDDNGTWFNSSDDVLSERTNNGFFRGTVLPEFEILRSQKGSLKYFGLNSVGEKNISGSVRIPTLGRLNRFYHLSAITYHGRPYDTSATVFFKRDRQNVSDYLSPFFSSPIQSSASHDLLGSHWRLKFPAWDSLFANGKDEVELVSGLTYEKYELDHSQYPLERGNRSRWAFPFGMGISFPIGSGQQLIRPEVLGHLYYYDRKGDANQSESQDYLLLSPRVDSEWNLSEDWLIRSILGYYYRAPSLSERFGSPEGVVPNSFLNVERAWKGEVGTDFTLKNPFNLFQKARFSYTASLAEARDLIVRVPNSQDSFIATNIGRSRILTQEVGTELHWDSHWLTGLSFTWMDARNLSPVNYQNGRTLPLRPTVRFQSRLGYQTSFLSAEYRAALNGASYWDLGNTRELPSLWDHGFVLGIYPKAVGDIRIEILNIFDQIAVPSKFNSNNQQIIDNTTGTPGYPMPGRRFYISWSYPI